MSNDAFRILRDPARLTELYRLDLLDTPADPTFDRLAHLAATIVQAPVALVVLLDADQQFFKSCVGLPEPWSSIRETPVSYSFCQHALLSGDPLIVEDAHQHPTFINNRAMRELGVVAYLGIPLVTSRGHTIGSFCVIDSQPRLWTRRDIEILQELAALVMAEIELRRDRIVRQRAEAAVRESEERFRQLAEHIREVFWLLDVESQRIIYVSPAYEEIWGRIPDSLYTAPRSFLKTIHPEDRQRVVTALEKRYQGEYDEEYRIVRPNGEVRWVRDRAFPIRNAAGAVYRIAGLAEDITGQKQTEAELLQHALYDALTGLANRALFSNRLQHVLAHAKRHQHAVFAVLLLDLDCFKTINDSLGHLVGDQLLIAVAHRVAACLRPADTVARWGGDEFAILLEDISDVSDAIHIAERIQQSLAAPFQLNGHQVITSASVGIAMSTSGYEQAEELLCDADSALYRAKALGKARSMVFDMAMHARVAARLQLEGDLRRAIERGEFLLHYQPIVSLATGKITCVEALLRWQHPQRGLMLPIEFISLTEETGLIVPLGEWVLRTACAQARAWHAAGQPPLVVAVNLSTRQFRYKGLPPLIAQVLEETGLEPHCLELELTETSIMEQEAEVAVTTLEQLKTLGVQISIDDFGTGYSSLSYLKRCPITAIKIGQVFVQDLNTDPDHAAITKATIALAHSLNLEVIAEGVATEAQLAFLRTQHCDAIQGHLVSCPLPAEALPPLLQDGSEISRRLLEPTDALDQTASSFFIGNEQPLAGHPYVRPA